MSHIVSLRLKALMDESLRRGLLLVPTLPADEVALVRRVKNGSYVRPFPHMYCDKERWTEYSAAQRYGLILATYTELHPSSVFAGITSLFIQGVVSHQIEQGCYIIEVATPSHTHTASSAQVKRICLKKGAQGVVRIINGFKVITVEKTLLDLARKSSFEDTIGYLFESIKNSLTSLHHIERALAHLRWYKGRSKLTYALKHLSLAVENAGEAKVFALISKMGYNLPQPQKQFFNPKYPEMPYRADFCWKTPLGLSVLELDGISTKRSKQVQSVLQASLTLQHNLERESELREQGVMVIKHLTFKEAMNPRTLARTLMQLHVQQGAQGKTKVADARSV